MVVKLLTEHHLEYLSLTGGCTGSSESTLVISQIVGNLMSRLILNLTLRICDKYQSFMKWPKLLKSAKRTYFCLCV